jgi:hypothetical protein
MINQTIDVTHNNPKAKTHIWKFNNDLSLQTQHKITNSSRNLNFGNQNLEILNYEISIINTTQTQKQYAMIGLWTMHITLTFIIRNWKNAWQVVMFTLFNFKSQYYFCKNQTPNYKPSTLHKCNTLQFYYYNSI